MFLQKLYHHRHYILLRSHDLLKDTLAKNSNSHHVKIGCELEFFLLKNAKPVVDKKIIDDFATINKLKLEQGCGQFEIVTDYSNNFIKLADDLQNQKNFIIDYADKIGYSASFSPRPFENDCPSSLQFNISFHDQDHNNVVALDDIYIKNLLNCLNQSTNSIFLILSPNVADFQRFALDYNLSLFKSGKYSAPVNISVGYENRTCGIRLTKKCFEPNSLRIEYRYGCSSADIYLTLSALLILISQSFLKKYSANASILFGNAFDNKYLSEVSELCKNYDQAVNLFFDHQNFVYKTFDNFLKDV